MDFRGLARWSRRSLQRIQAEGLAAGLSKSFYIAYKTAWGALTRLDIGRNVFEEEWDLLVVLDGCRVDVLEEVAPEYSFLEDVTSVWSAGSGSKEWMSKTFGERNRSEIQRTAYVSANPFTEKILGGQHDIVVPEIVKEVWRYGSDETLGTVPPRPVTDATIRTSRGGHGGYLMAHYMQPHYPFIPEDAPLKNQFKIRTFSEDDEEDTEWAVGDALSWSPWYALREGTISRGDLWESYKMNLRAVLDDVEILLENVDAERVVITADHGNAMGEWGIYGHPNGFMHPSVRKVPWVETTAEDRGTHEPAEPEGNQTVEREQLLRALGYM